MSARQLPCGNRKLVASYKLLCHHVRILFGLAWTLIKPFSSGVWNNQIKNIQPIAWIMHTWPWFDRVLCFHTGRFCPSPLGLRHWRQGKYQSYPLLSFAIFLQCLTHWGQVTHLCFGNLTIIGSDNDLSPSRRQAIIWTNDGILLIGPLGTNFSEISIEILTFSFKKMYLKVSSAKWRPFVLAPMS